MDDVSKEPTPSQNQPNAAESASTAQKIKAEFATIAKRIVAWAKAVVGYIVQILEWSINGLVKLFWWISDYGSSTWQVIKAFLLLNVFFTLIYSFVHLLPVTTLSENTTGIIEELMSIIISFMQTTLIPFSIVGIELENLSCFCLHSLVTVLVTVHVISGYVILAALVTRLAIMFQDQGP
ncbi:MAG TPA: hypothetical protein O0X23_01535 [Methanocorpusculum sp.]|nr:hypothetical protein [Methanocorpusculum sp.]